MFFLKKSQKVFERRNVKGTDIVLKIEGNNVFYKPSGIKTLNINKNGFCKSIEWFCQTHICTLEQLQKLSV